MSRSMRNSSFPAAPNSENDQENDQEHDRSRLAELLARIIVRHLRNAPQATSISSESSGGPERNARADDSVTRG